MESTMEFEATYLKTKGMIDALSNIGIDVSMYSEELKRIKKECHNSIKSNYSLNTSVQMMRRANNDLVYQKAASKLRKLQNELHVYDIYLKAYYYPKSFDFKQEYSLEQIEGIALETISLLKDVRSNSILIYDKGIIDELYKFAYKVIKLELSYKRKSTLLDWARSDVVASSYINEEIKKDIKLLDGSNTLISAAIARLKTNGVDYNLLDEALINYLIIQNDDEFLREIKKELYSLLEKLKTIEEKISNMNKLEDEYKDYINCYKPIFVDYLKIVAKTLASVSVIVSLVIGSFKLSKNLSKVGDPYTKSIVYSKQDEALTPVIDGYRESVERYNQVNVIEYGTWQEVNNGYERVITTYDVTDYNYGALENYYDMDLSGVSGIQEVQVNSELNAEDLYDEVIREVERIIQNPDDLEEDTFFFWYIFIFCLFGSGMIYAMAELLIYFIKDKTFWEIIKDDIKELKKDKRKYIEYMGYLKTVLETKKDLILSNREYREKFINLYNKFAPFIQDKKLDQKINKLVREKNEEAGV